MKLQISTVHDYYKTKNCLVFWKLNFKFYKENLKLIKILWISLWETMILVYIITYPEPYLTFVNVSFCGRE